MTKTRKVIGKVSVPRGEFTEGMTYYLYNVVTFLGSAFMCTVDSTTVAPARLEDDGKTIVLNPGWIFFADATASRKVESAVKALEDGRNTDNNVLAETLVSLAARIDALEGSRGLLGNATVGTLDVLDITKCRYPLVMMGHGVPAETTKPTNLPEGLPWDGLPMFKGQQYINLDAPSGGLYYAVGVDSVNDWKQA